MESDSSDRSILAQSGHI